MKTMSEVQAALPWALGYSEAFEHANGDAVNDAATDGSTMRHLDFTHALLHVVKATGKLAAMSENADHNRKAGGDPTLCQKADCRASHAMAPTNFPREDSEKYLADLVICAMRMTSVRPGGSFDLWDAVLRRIDSKNGSNLAAGSGLSAASPACAPGKPSGDTSTTRGESHEARLLSVISIMGDALGKIERWEVPDDQGSNGEREFMRNEARLAIGRASKVIVGIPVEVTDAR